MPFDGTSFTDSTEALYVLTKARTHLAEASKWIKHDYADGERFCLLGAIMHYAEHDDKLVTSIVSQLAKHIRNTPGRRSSNPAGKVVMYNDSPRVKHQQIIHILDKTIEEITNAGLHQGTCYML